MTKHLIRLPNITSTLTIICIAATKLFVFSAMIMLNISVVQYPISPSSLVFNLNSAIACPDDVSDCMVVTPDENDYIEHGSGGIVFDGGSSAGGGSVGSGGGASGGSSGNSGSVGDSALGKSEEEIARCKADFQEIKDYCIRNASLKRIANDKEVCNQLTDISVNIFGITIISNERTLCYSENSHVLQADIATCNYNYSRGVARVCH